MTYVLSAAVIGIDPGVRGGIAALAPGGAVIWLTTLRPEMSQVELVAAVAAAVEALKLWGGKACFMERVGYIRGDGGQGAFTFGRVNGLLRGAAIAFGLKVFDVTPMMWQAEMQCLTGGNKNVSKRRAIELFPAIKVTHATADALLIAEFGRRRLTATPA